jgi:DNA-binding transcriptional LysR family regulator
VQLTDRGRSFQNSVTVALTHLANATDELRIDHDQSQIKIATDMSIPMMWLFPKLHLFERKHPECTIKLEATDIQSDLLATDFHAAIVHGQGDWVGYDSQLLFKEEVFPVCAPSYLKENPDILSLENLPQAKLLDLEYEHWHWMNWSIWLTEKELTLPKAPRKLRINNYPMVIDAACKGHGVALGWRHLVDQHIEDGTLLRISSSSIKTDYGYYLIWPHNLKMAEMADKFREWCLEQASVNGMD